MKSKLGWVFVGLLGLATMGAGQQQQGGLHVTHTPGPVVVSTRTLHRQAPKKKDKSVHHAAMHAEHWINHHVSAPHGKAYQHRVAKRNHNARHAIKHAEHWINHHVSAPHKHNGG